MVAELDIQYSATLFTGITTNTLQCDVGWNILATMNIKVGDGVVLLDGHDDPPFFGVITCIDDEVEAACQVYWFDLGEFTWDTQALVEDWRRIAIKIGNGDIVI